MDKAEENRRVRAAVRRWAIETYGSDIIIEVDDETGFRFTVPAAQEQADPDARG